MAEGNEKNRWLKPVMTAGTILFFLLLGGLCVYAWQAGLFRDIDRLQAFIQRCGVWAPLVFVLMQIAQILLAFIPGGPMQMEEIPCPIACLRCFCVWR